jgi:hypothetical protein
MMKTRIDELVARGRAKLTNPAALAIADDLVAADGHCRSQDDLAKVLPPDATPPRRDAALRVVRGIVRELRVAFGFPIASCADGYFLPVNQAQVDEFMARVEREAKARARSSLETYRALRDVFSMPPQSDFMEALQGSVEDGSTTLALRLENAALRAKVRRWGRPSNDVRKIRLADAAKVNLQSDLFGVTLPRNGCGNGQDNQNRGGDL